MKAVVMTLGCKVNDVESGSIIRGLEEMGYEVSREPVFADVYILNTCAVTAEAERKSRQAVGRLLKNNPNAKIIVCGCASEKSPESFTEKNVFAVSGAMRKNRVLDIVASGFADDYCGKHIENTAEYEEMATPECLKTRNFVKIQDGCDNFCTYCIIPYLRGRSRSRNFESAVKEILESDAQETVITGIDISSYKDGEKDLGDLLLAIKDANTRIRLGSIEVSLITEKFLSCAKQVKNFAPQFHLCLQSGSTKVLKSMNRHYTREEYLEKCKMIYSEFPDASITTDIIVGFPTETEEDFLDTLDIVEKVGYLHIHAFPYSPREGTNAWKKYKELPSDVKKIRLDTLMQKGEETHKNFIEKRIGKEYTMVPETFDGEFTDGYTENYTKVYVKGKIEKVPTKVKIVSVYKDGAIAEKV